MVMYHEILIIDDDEDDRTILADAIGEVSPGSSVTQAIDAVEAFEFLGKATRLPDLVFLDLNMPRMNGREFLKKIKRLTAFRHIPVIIYSTSSRKEDMDEAQKSGAVYFLTKPVLFKEICRELSVLLSKKW